MGLFLANNNTLWTPADHGLLTWNYDPIACQSTSSTGTAGLLNLMKVHLPNPGSVTNVLMHVATVGATLTASQCLAALYDAAGNRIGVTADQSVAWTSLGMKTMALASGPFACAAGDYYVAYWYQGTTAPGFSRTQALASSLFNVGLSATASRAASADSGLTTTAPPTLGAKTATGYYPWVGLS